MREFINIVTESEWKDLANGKSNPQELCIGARIIQINTDKKKAEMDGGPFFSSFDLNGATEDELKADAIRQAYKELKKLLSEFEAAATEMGVSLG